MPNYFFQNCYLNYSASSNAGDYCNVPSFMDCYWVVSGFFRSLSHIYVGLNPCLSASLLPWLPGIIFRPKIVPCISSSKLVIKTLNHYFCKTQSILSSCLKQNCWSLPTVVWTLFHNQFYTHFVLVSSSVNDSKLQLQYFYSMLSDMS